MTPTSSLVEQHFAKARREAPADERALNRHLALLNEDPGIIITLLQGGDLHVLNAGQLMLRPRRPDRLFTRWAAILRRIADTGKFEVLRLEEQSLEACAQAPPAKANVVVPLINPIHQQRQPLDKEQLCEGRTTSTQAQSNDWQIWARGREQSKWRHPCDSRCA